MRHNNKWCLTSGTKNQQYQFWENQEGGVPAPKETA